MKILHVFPSPFAISSLSANVIIEDFKVLSLRKRVAVLQKDLLSMDFLSAC